MTWPSQNYEDNIATMRSNDALRGTLYDATRKLCERFGGEVRDSGPHFPRKIRHIKTQKQVWIKGVALQESTLEPVVIYRCNGIVFTRPLPEFMVKFRAETWAQVMYPRSGL